MRDIKTNLECIVLRMCMCIENVSENGESIIYVTKKLRETSTARVGQKL